ncbi:MAG: hypothetical protein KDJ38_03630 [Gammaproteobacteria bacterium]|nr:hypothetical protein [Gammaproteobacteria bacterium]
MANNDRHYPYLTRAMQALLQRARSRGLETAIEPSTGFSATIAMPDRTAIITGADCGLNGSAAARLSADKYFTEFFLRRQGIACVASRLLDQSDEVSALNPVYPCIVKPNKGLAGQGFSRVDTAQQITRAVAFARQYCPQVLVQPLIHKREFRLVLLDGELLYAYERKPWVVVGDGRTSIAGFIRQRNEVCRPGNAIDEDDPGLLWQLHNTGKDLHYVPADNEAVQLFANANLKKGASSHTIEVFDTAYLEIVASAVHAIGLRYAGVDLFCNQPERFDLDYAILEINANPGFDHLQKNPQQFKTVLDRIAAALFD